jgi:hypothetical protein
MSDTPVAEPAAEPVPAEAGAPGKPPQAAALAGAEPEPTPGLSPSGQGAQVVLTGDAQAAARGGPHGEIVANTKARDAAIVAGHVVPGTTAEAASDATSGAAVDDLDDEEAAAIAKLKAGFAERRAQRATRKPGQHHPEHHG